MEHQWRLVGKDSKARVRVEQCDACLAIRRVGRDGAQFLVKAGKNAPCATAP